jgi:ABC-2 type transport system permease protein
VITHILTPFNALAAKSYYFCFSKKKRTGMRALFLKEIRSFLSSLTGYIVITIFLAVTGLFLWVIPSESNILDYGYANLDGLFIIGPFVFLFLVPAVTMRSFADERKSGTIELLFTRPLSDFRIVWAKYTAAVVLVIFSLIPTLIYYVTVYRLGFPAGNIDSGGFWGSFIGLFLLGAVFVSIGIFASAVTDNPVVSFVLAVLTSAFLYLGFEFISSLNLFGNFDLFIKSLGISDHYSSISRGVIDTRDLVYFFSVTGLFLFLTKFSLTARKW